MRRLGTLLLALAAVGAANPDGSLVYSPPTWPEPPDLSSLILRLAVGTAVVLGLCVGMLWLGKRRLRRQAPQGQAGSPLQLVETLTLANRCCLSLLKAGSAQILVAADGSGLKKMVALPESFENTLAQLDGEAEAGAPGGADFRSVLQEARPPFRA